MTAHDRRFRCSRSALVFTYEDEDGNTRCVTCQHILTPKETP